MGHVKSCYPRCFFGPHYGRRNRSAILCFVRSTAEDVFIGTILTSEVRTAHVRIVGRTGCLFSKRHCSSDWSCIWGLNARSPELAINLLRLCCICRWAVSF